MPIVCVVFNIQRSIADISKVCKGIELTILEHTSTYCLQFQDIQGPILNTYISFMASTSNITMENWTDVAYCDYAPQDEYIGFCLAMPVIMILMTILICGGNCLTILAVWKTPSLQTMPNMFIVSLAVADFITGMAYGYDSLWYISYTEVFIYNCKACCLLSVFMLYLSLHMSMACVIAIALDRYIYIMHPFLYIRVVTAFTIQIIIAVIWTLSMVLAAVPFFQNTFDNVGYCAHFGILPDWLQIYTEISIFMLVFLICAIPNAAIVHLTMKKQREMRSLNVTCSGRTSTHTQRVAQRSHILHYNVWLFTFSDLKSARLVLNISL